MNRSVCIHGHFYQPPRENPVTDEVPEQPSAAPAHDWNERITDECYAPNAAARVLGEDGAVERTISNYARIGFDFGPTLLRWLERHRRDVHRAVVDADAESAARFGRGSAIAQVYHHAILPLSSPRDRRTEIRWGIRDFELRFRRAPEGMWLSECAADVPTLEELAAQGIGFTILSPRQAARVRPPRSAAWVDVDAETLDPRRAYRVPLPSGRSIAAFFYDGPLSQGVAFEGLTDDGAAFAERIVGAFRDDGADDAQLVHLATDGESYGHHRKFAEMGLAFALTRLEATPDVELTNHASFLAAHPPTWDAEIVEPSSWSCAHGVERWRSDCGCRMAGGSQAWRGPLREAFDFLRDALAPRFEHDGAALFRDPWDARDAFADVVVRRDETARSELLRRFALPGADPERALGLLEMQRHALAMYTSCGWFFDDLAGIEGRQVMLHAGRVVQLADRWFGPGYEAPFLDRLARAESNDPAEGNGRDLYLREVRPLLAPRTTARG